MLWLCSGHDVTKSTRKGQMNENPDKKMGRILQAMGSKKMADRYLVSSDSLITDAAATADNERLASGAITPSQPQ